MDNHPNSGPIEFLAGLVHEQERQAVALERLGSTADAIARDLWSLAAGSMKVALVYPWPSQPTIFRAVLVQGADEARRLAEALPRFEKTQDQPTDTQGVYGDKSHVSLEEWLRSESFRPIDVTQIHLGKYDGMFAAPKDEPVKPVAAKREIGELKLELEVAPSVEPEPHVETQAA